MYHHRVSIYKSSQIQYLHNHLPTTTVSDNLPPINILHGLQFIMSLKPKYKIIFILAVIISISQVIATPLQVNTIDLNPSEHVFGRCAIGNLMELGRCGCYVRWKIDRKGRNDKYIKLCFRYISRKPGSFSSSCNRYNRRNYKAFRKALSKDLRMAEKCVRALGGGSALG